MTTVAVENRQRIGRRRGSYEEYLALPDDGRVVEWANGEIIEHMPPTSEHQRIAGFLERLLAAYVDLLKLGEVFDAPIEVKLWPDGPSREPDILFISSEQGRQMRLRRFEGAPALVVEIVSRGSVTIDRITKFREYEQAGVREYWIIDPRPHQQQADFYIRDVAGNFSPAPLTEDGVYHSTVVPGFRLPVAYLWQTPLPNHQLVLARMLADAPGISDELRALYREMARLLG